MSCLKLLLITIFMVFTLPYPSQMEKHFSRSYPSVLTILEGNYSEEQFNPLSFNHDTEEAIIIIVSKNNTAEVVLAQLNLILIQCSKLYSLKGIENIYLCIEYVDNLVLVLSMLSKVFTGGCFNHSSSLRFFVHVFANEAQQRQIMKKMMPSFPINSQVYVIFQDLQHNSTSIWEMYQYKNVSVLNLIDQFKENSKECREALKLVQKYHLGKPISVRRGNLSGVNINAVAQNDPDYQPRIQTELHEHGRVQFVGGMCLDVLNIMQFMMHFSYTAVDGKGWMGLFPNGSWTGMSGQVVNGEADISISQASTIMMTDQVIGISFLHPTSKGNLVAIFRQPMASSIRDIIRSAFQPYLWICYFVMWIALLICLRIVYKIFYNQHMVYEADYIFYEGSPWWAISATCNLGWHMTPPSVPLRMIFTMGFFFGSLIYVGYSASLMTNLSTEMIPVRNAEQLVESIIPIFSDKWLPMSQTLMENMYRKRKSKLKNRESHFDQLETIIPNLLNHSLAFITFPDAISVVFHRLNFSDSFYCRTVSTVVVSRVSYPNSMYVKRGSPLKEIFNVKILMMIERGFVSRLARIYDKNTQILCVLQHHSYRGGLTMRDTVTPFLFIISGFLLSLLALGVEKRARKIMKLRNLEGMNDEDKVSTWYE